MTDPSNANTSGLEVVAWRWKGFDGYFVVNPNQPKPFDAEPLVTAASAQARIAELEESDKNGRENWDGIIGPLSSYASGQDDYDPILDAAPDGGPDVVGQTFIALLEARKDRATAAEARADRLAKFGQHTNWEMSHGYPDGEEEDGCWLVHSVNGGRNDREWTLIGRGETPDDAIRAALQQETQP